MHFTNNHRVWSQELFTLRPSRFTLNRQITTVRCVNYNAHYNGCYNGIRLSQIDVFIGP